MNNTICIADTNPQVLAAPTLIAPIINVIEDTVSTTPRLVASIINVIEDTVSVEHVEALTHEVTATPMTAESDDVLCYPESKNMAKNQGKTANTQRTGHLI